MRVSIHGVVLEVDVGSVALGSAAQELFAGFDAADGVPEAVVRCRSAASRADVPVAVPGDARLLSAVTGIGADGAADGRIPCTIHRAGARLFVDLGARGVIVIEYASRHVDAFVVDADASSEALSSVVRFAATEVLRSCGLYVVHAAGADRDGRGLLVVGASGKGKTTTLMALLRAGYRVLSDDHPLLRESDGEMELLSFPTKIDVTDKTVELVPELSAAAERLHAGVIKRWFHVDEIFPGQEALTSRPRVLLFPEVIDWPRSRIDPLPRSRALEGLLRESLLVLDRDVSERHLRVLSRLVEQSDCYRLRLGADFLDIPRDVDRLVADAGSP